MPQGQHERAVEFFRRALKLNRHYLAAWTLMGHEYMELKNTQAAISEWGRQMVGWMAWWRRVRAGGGVVDALWMRG